ncbi:hypothetical protein LC603019_01609 [Lawsonella clevelandensis]|uniref:Uncharacterized protein n=1 Tax=Lawsonella clevelandensis TaxID=1528099 RepID=A0A5E4A0B2_9ACTN|nr:hypothetical protein LC603019_01609 [Lawsonella clevelandensis]
MITPKDGEITKKDNETGEGEPQAFATDLLAPLLSSPQILHETVYLVP